MLRLFVKDNMDGSVHEYGTNRHDSLCLQEDGSLHYENLQSGTGTMFPDEGYSFCLSDGTIPDLDHPEYDGCIDIGGARQPEQWILLGANNKESEIRIDGVFPSQEAAAEAMFVLMRGALANNGWNIEVYDGLDHYESEIEITATKSGGTIHYVSDNDICYWDIKKVPDMPGGRALPADFMHAGTFSD